MFLGTLAVKCLSRNIDFISMGFRLHCPFFFPMRDWGTPLSVSAGSRGRKEEPLFLVGSFVSSATRVTCPPVFFRLRFFLRVFFWRTAFFPIQRSSSSPSQVVSLLFPCALLCRASHTPLSHVTQSLGIHVLPRLCHRFPWDSLWF